MWPTISRSSRSPHVTIGAAAATGVFATLGNHEYFQASQKYDGYLIRSPIPLLSITDTPYVAQRAVLLGGSTIHGHMGPGHARSSSGYRRDAADADGDPFAS